MKKLNTLLLGLLLLFVGFACTNKEEEPETPEEPDVELEMTAPVIITPDAEAVIDLATAKEVEISWDAAEINVEEYAVTYKVALALEGFDDLEMEFTPANNGKDTELTVDVSALDELLMINGIPTKGQVNATILLTAKCLEVEKTDEVNVVVQRSEVEPDLTVEKLFISGTASEGGEDITVATSMKRLSDMVTGEMTNSFEVYTSLNVEGTYKFFTNNEMPAYNFGGADGMLELAGSELKVEEAGEYRVFVNMDSMSYELTRITSWGLIGDPIKGWGEDVPLDYVGGGVWKGNFFFQHEANMIFRSNGDWENFVGKKVAGTENVMYVGPDASEGLEDLHAPGVGAYIVTLDLSGTQTGYTYKIEKDEDATPSGPETLFVLSAGNVITELKAHDEVPGLFNSKMMPLQQGVEYTMNTKEDGSGTSYTIAGGTFGEEASDDKKSGDVTIEEGDATFTVGFTQAYGFEVNFNTNGVKWHFYNLKVFHSQWDDTLADGAGDWVWDPRDEFVMEYVHPFTYKVTAEFKEGYASKIYSPWDIVIGLPLDADQTAMSGAIAENKIITEVDEDGNKKEPIHFRHSSTNTYELTIELDAEYATGTYSFE